MDEIQKIQASRYNDKKLTDSGEKSIIILLESPHKGEYDYSNGLIKPIAPAQASTGKNIENNIVKVLRDLVLDYSCKLNNGTYRLLIVNPIPYQTSLHYLHAQPIKSSMYKKLRNEV